MTVMSMVEAVCSALGDEMERDERVIVLGEDVGKSGGVFRATDGLQKRFGAERVVDTPVSEAVIVGALDRPGDRRSGAGARTAVPRLQPAGVPPDRPPTRPLALPHQRPLPRPGDDPCARTAAGCAPPSCTPTASRRSSPRCPG